MSTDQPASREPQYVWVECDANELAAISELVREATGVPSSEAVTVASALQGYRERLLNVLVERDEYEALGLARRDPGGPRGAA